MEKSVALHIIQALAQGIDPHTGGTFPADSPYQHPDTVRALFDAAQALAGSAELREPRSVPENAGKPWTDAEDQTLIAAFDTGTPIPELAAQFGRSRVAIQARLILRGKLQPSAKGPRFRMPPPSAHASV